MSTWEERMAAKAEARRPKPEDDPCWTPREEAEKHRDEYCLDCCEVRIDGVWGWRCFLTCGHPCKFDHRHHDGEVWLA